jgi:hypothetical protein
MNAGCLVSQLGDVLVPQLGCEASGSGTYSVDGVLDVQVPEPGRAVDLALASMCPPGLNATEYTEAAAPPPVRGWLSSVGRAGSTVQRWRIRSRRHRSTVCGVTNSGQWPRGTSRLSAAWTARSAQESRGRATCRRNTASWWRSTKISASFDARLRPSKPSQPTAVRKIR